RIQGAAETRHGLRHPRTHGRQRLRPLAGRRRARRRRRSPPAALRGDSAGPARAEGVDDAAAPSRAGDCPMTSDHPLRRVLAHVCSPDTMARVVDPVLADLRFENGRPVWRGYLTLARALTVHAALSLPGAVSRLWTDDDRAIPRAVSMCVVTALLIAAPLVAPPALNVGRLYSWRAVILLVPQALVLALPASLLVAIPMGFRRTTTGRVVVRGLVLSVLCAALTLALRIRVMPDVNQALRVEVAQRLAPRPVHVPRGSIEMTLRELREHIEVLRLTPGGVRVARRLEYTYHLKLALSMVALPLGVLSISMAR